MRYAILAIILISCAPIYATPSISVITGTSTITQGGPLHITGTNFTSYSTTTGTFDTFENGTFNSYWAATNALSIRTSGQRNSFSIRNAQDTLTSTSNDDAALQGAGNNRRSWYVSFWWYVGSNWVWGSGTFGSSPTQWLSNIKIIRFWNSGNFLENVYLGWVGFNGSLYFLEEGIGASANHVLHIGPARLTLNTWHEFRVQFVDSSAAGVSDGSMEIWFDTMTIYNATNQLYKDTENQNKRPQRIGFQNEWGCNDNTSNTTPCTPGDFYMDNTYAFDQISRVEICENAVYTGCTYPPEIQGISSWNGTDIVIQYNAGSLPVDQYVFVIDNAGVPSAGFHITGLTGSGSAGTPHTGLNGQAHLTGKGAMK